AAYVGPHLCTLSTSCSADSLSLFLIRIQVVRSAGRVERAGGGILAVVAVVGAGDSIALLISWISFLTSASGSDRQSRSSRASPRIPWTPVIASLSLSLNLANLISRFAPLSPL